MVIAYKGKLKHLNKKPLHNTALAALLSTFRPRHLHEPPPVPSVSISCEIHILQSSTKEQIKLVLLETVGQSLFEKVFKDIYKKPMFCVHIPSTSTRNYYFRYTFQFSKLQHYLF